MKTREARLCAFDCALLFLKNISMKKESILAVVLLVPFFLFCQKPFAPLGAKWGGLRQCSPTFWPCPPDYPYYHTFEVTEDTVIQGKYCTFIDDQDWDWDFGDENSIIHQDGHQIYRYDRASKEFKLVLDFSKDIGESWQVEAPYWGYDTLTITVIEKDGDYRKVAISGNSPIFSGLPLYEGFGGLVQNKRLLLGYELFIIADPIVWDELTCYIDPVEGLLYGSASGCELSSTSIRDIDKSEFVVYPNPASTQIFLDCNYPLTKATEWSLSDALGQEVESQSLAPGTALNSMTIDKLAKGIYFWKVQTQSEIIGIGKIIVVR